MILIVAIDRFWVAGYCSGRARLARVRTKQQSARGNAVMSIFDPEILQELCGLSVGLCVTGAAVGLLLWLTGWWLHRFWIVLATTALAGILGLASGSVHGVQPLIAAVLLAIAAGILALALIRLVAFAAGGAAADSARSIDALTGRTLMASITGFQTVLARYPTFPRLPSPWLSTSMDTGGPLVVQAPLPQSGQPVNRW